MTRRILLHVGSPKCGSTYLQQVMRQNGESLAAAGVCYPEPEGGHPGNAGALADVDAARVESWFSAGIDTVVLSHEDLFSMAKKGDALHAITARERISVQVIMFLRPFSEFMFGDYSQFMKQHFESYLSKREPYGGMSFRDFTERRARTMKPAAYARNWNVRFDQNRIILAGHREIRRVIEGLIGPQAVANWEVHPTLTNPSLRMEDCDRIAAAMRDREIPDEAIRDMLRAAYRQTADADAGKTAERVAFAEAQFAAQNELLLSEFGFDNRRAS
ncbi:hypothetical protein [Rhodobacter maris]|uniref:Sulfotransferase domain-containing protein n=1 Tax=Rhodobacter maris TaxID=446682 RepID=A0A285SEZ2_9RHOB|nr:hypothetical protein [Rhodobacter maris]SOC06457.1 hypothetical protein SAMN05877831_10523 [Rhodobacter maris]